MDVRVIFCRSSVHVEVVEDTWFGYHIRVCAGWIVFDRGHKPLLVRKDESRARAATTNLLYKECRRFLQA